MVFELGEVRGNIWLAAVPATGDRDRWTHGVAE
jgi:hypothetical protein